MKDLKELANYYINQLDGPNSEDAYHSLIEADDEIIPFLIEAFRSINKISIRAELVEIIWQHRVPSTLEFLSAALSDNSQEVWKSALNGIVMFGGKNAVILLHNAKQNILTKHNNATIKIEWIDEAIEQIEEKLNL